MMLVIPIAAYASDVIVNVNIPELFYLKVQNNVLNFTGNNAPTLADFNRDASKLQWSTDTDPGSMSGYGYTNVYLDPGCTVYANAGWTAWIKGTADHFSGPYDKPAADIIWMDGIVNGWHRLTTVGDPLLVHTMDHEPEGGNFPFVLDFRILLRWAYDLPGDYTYNYVELTLTHD